MSSDSGPDLLTSALDFLPFHRRTRAVRLGIVDIVWPFATHWAVQVEDRWFEVEGASKEQSNSHMRILSSRGQRSAVGEGADTTRFGHVGETRKTNLEIFGWIQLWKWKNPRYGFDGHNCQLFSRDFIVWLTDAAHKPLPMMDAAVSKFSSEGPTSWSGAERGAAYAGVMLANLQTHHGVFNYAMVALRASVASLWGPLGRGLFSEAELGRIEAGIGPLRVAIHLNINTSAGFRNNGFELSVAGCGFAIGANGFSVSVPVCTVGIAR